MRREVRCSGRHLVLGALLFLLATSTASARSFFYFGGNAGYGVPTYIQGGGYAYGVPDSGYSAALTRTTTPAYALPPAADYLGAVCGQGTYRWQADKLPIKVWIADGSGSPGYKPIFNSYVRRGFDAWCEASGNKLSWVEINDPSQADVTVRWTNRVTERPEGTEAGRTSALTRLNTSTGQGIIYGARMLFLTRLPDRYFADEEVEKTCLHECGHALGLQGHSPYRDDIMYYAVHLSQYPQLSERDRNTLAKLYANYPVLDSVALKVKTPSSIGQAWR